MVPQLRANYAVGVTRCTPDDFLLISLFGVVAVAVQGGPLYRLLRGFDVRIVGMLRSLLTESIAGWVKFVEQNCHGTAADKVEEVAHRGDKIHATSSLFTAELVVEDATVELQPSLQEIQDYLLNQLDHAIRIARDLTAIDSDVMSLLQLPRRVLLNVGVEDPLFEDVDAVISNATSYLKNLIDHQLAAPRHLIEEFQQVRCFLLLAHINLFGQSVQIFSFRRLFFGSGTTVRLAARNGSGGAASTVF
jgi:hypothetical protein